MRSVVLAGCIAFLNACKTFWFNDSLKCFSGMHFKIHCDVSIRIKFIIIVSLFPQITSSALFFNLNYAGVMLSSDVWTQLLIKSKESFLCLLMKFWHSYNFYIIPLPQTLRSWPALCSSTAIRKALLMWLSTEAQLTS